MRQSKIKRTNSRIQLNPKIEQKQQKINVQSWSPVKIDIVIQNQNKLNQVPKILRGFNTFTFQNGSIVASQLIEDLKKKNYLQEQTSVSYYLPSRSLYVFGLIVPKGSHVQSHQQIKSKFLEKNTLTIKVRQRKKINIQVLIQEQRQRYGETQDDKVTKGQKQKKICQVVQKVALWRKFYTGFSDQSGNLIQKQLDIAAQQVGIAKKTLDDYLLQIRNGKKYGFNFNEKFNSRIGQLRAFVRDEKKKQGGK